MTLLMELLHSDHINTKYEHLINIFQTSSNYLGVFVFCVQILLQFMDQKLCKLFFPVDNAYIRHGDISFSNHATHSCMATKLANTYDVLTTVDRLTSIAFVMRILL